MEDLYQFRANRCVEDFNRKCDMLFDSFKYTNSYVRNVLFHNYCAAFYGSQILPLFNNCLDDICTAWRVAMVKVWRVPWTTHCNLLPHLVTVMEPEFWFV